MKTSETISEISKALAGLQAQLPTLPKNAKGYGYNYTPLDVVVDSIRHLMAEHGLFFVQFPSTPPVEYYPSVCLTTRIMHKSGEWFEDTAIMPVPTVGKANETQNYGAALTYARRYALTSILGIVADEDSDGTIQNNAPRQPQQQPAKQQAPASASQRRPSEKMLKKLYAVGKNYYGDEWDEKRALLVEAITGGRTSSSKQLTVDECSKLIDGIQAKRAESQPLFDDDNNGAYAE